MTELTAKLIANGISHVNKMNEQSTNNWIVCGGGRKNQFLIENIKNNFEKLNIDTIEKYKIDGDFVESQAFAFLAIRSLEGMPISFPTTTRCKQALTGGVVVKNF